MIIAIDGLVGTGKGTTAKGVAHKLNGIFIDTGAMYRTTALHLIRQNVDRNNPEEMTAHACHTHMTYEYNQVTDHYDIILNGENVESLIRTPDVTIRIQHFVALPQVRAHIVETTRQIADKYSHNYIIVDGRDTATVVFPDAPVKVFLTCDLETRIERRYQSFLAKNQKISKDTIRHNMKTRDRVDYLGPHAANYKCPDATILDTTDRTIDQQIEFVANLVHQAQKDQPDT